MGVWMKAPWLIFLSLIFLTLPSALHAQDMPSGNYENLVLAVDSGAGTLSGYFSDSNGYSTWSYDPHFTCRLFLTGKRDGDHYVIQAWKPADRDPIVIGGTLNPLSRNKPAVRLALAPLPGDCWSVNPALGKADGAKLSLQKAQPYAEVRMVSAPKAHFYAGADGAPGKDYVVRGDVLAVMETKGEFARVQFEGKDKGWVRQDDLFAMIPVSTPRAPKLSVAEKSTGGARAIPGVPPKGLVDQLRIIDAQAFEMALSVFQDPGKRPELSPKAAQLEKDLNSTVGQLNVEDPKAYKKEGEAISETFLDLQYVKQPQQVVSRRLNQVMSSVKK